MPELPDVEVLRRYFDSTALHQEVGSVEVRSETVLKDITPQVLGRKLVGDSFGTTERHGKFLFAGLEESGDWVVLHFGMTGGLKYDRQVEKEPQYGLVFFHFRNDYSLAYVMTRKLGEVRVIADPDGFIEARELGPDVYADAFTLETFLELLRGRRGMVKSAMMNQRIMAGIGNVYTDEILFQAVIHPKTKVNDLSEEDLRTIFQQMKRVLQTAIDHQADPGDYPESYLTPLRGEPGADCPQCEGKLERIEVSGRAGYYCPGCQEKRG